MWRSLLPVLCVLSALACVNDVEDGTMGSLLGGAAGSDEEAVHAVCGSGSTVFGVDVSKWQGTINWGSVANAGVKFAFIRVSDGTGYIDEKFATNWSGAKSHGILRGAYQFFRSNQDPIAQANLLISKMGTLQAGDLPPVVDVESTDGVSAATRRQKLHQWLDRVEAATGLKPIIYTGGYFWDDNVAGDFSEYPLWHAGYTGGTCPSTVSSHWSTWKIWQYSSSGSVSGISGNVDVDRFNGTLAQLRELGLDPCVPSAEVCNGVDDNCDGVADEGDACTPRDEAVLGAALFDQSGSTADVDGDGRADVCARAAAGVVCNLSGGGGADPLSVPVSSTIFSSDSGWDDVSNYATLRLGDVDGDGKADLCARANAGVVCKTAKPDGSGFGAASLSGPAWADASGWNKPQYYSTFRLADVDGDGKADVCARAAAGFRCHLSTGAGFGDAVAGSPAFFSDAQGFDDPNKYGTIRMADVDGDGRADACARGADGLECHRLQDDGTWGPAITGPAWSDAHGFNKVQYASTLRFADLDGDGRADACIRASDAIHCRLATADGGFSSTDIVGPALSDDNGWNDDDNYATIRFADVTGDGRADLCARANAAAFCWPFVVDAAGGGTFGARIDGPDFFSDANGFNKPEHWRTFRVADVNRDNKADLCGRDAAGFTCFLSDGAAFTTRVDGSRWDDAHGWAAMQFSGTFLVSGFARIPLLDYDDTAAGTGRPALPPPHDPDDTAVGDDGDDGSLDDPNEVDVDAPPHKDGDGLTTIYGGCSSFGAASSPASTAPFALLALCLPLWARRARAASRRHR